MTVTPPEYVTAVMNLIESGDVSWDDPDVARVLKDSVRGQSPKANNGSKTAINHELTPHQPA